MFFEETNVSDLLKCSKCRNKINEPRILPCGFTICSQCHFSIDAKNNQFKCIVCNDLHIMPERGFPLNLLALAILNLRPVEVYRGQIAAKLKHSLDSLNRKIEILNIVAYHEKEQVEKCYSDLREQTSSVLEETVEQIKDFSEQLTSEIDNFEKNNLLALRSNQKSKLEFLNMCTKLEQFHSNWSEYLKKVAVDDEEISNANNQAAKLIEQAEDAELSLDSLIFSDKQLKFNENPNKLNEPLVLASLHLENTRLINSSILSDQELISLMKLCGFPLDLNWKLLYRASRDGWQSDEFHSRCDNKPNTFAIIHTRKGFVFGGYTQQSWSHTGDYKTDPNAFIFSFRNRLKRPLMMPCQKPNHAIYCHRSYGPVFGAIDFAICLEPLSKTMRCTAELGHSYSHPEYTYKTSEARSFLAGGYLFFASEIEIFTKE